MFARLTDVFLGKMAGRQMLPNAKTNYHIVSNIAGIVSLPRPHAKETTQLTKCWHLRHAFAYFAVGWLAENQQCRNQTTLERAARFGPNLKRTVFRALRDLTMAAFYMTVCRKSLSIPGRLLILPTISDRQSTKKRPDADASKLTQTKPSMCRCSHIGTGAGWLCCETSKAGKSNHD
jgi:hypothetical protein